MPITEAAKQTPYTSTFLRLLARQGKLNAQKIGRDWLITQADLRQFLSSSKLRHANALVDLQHAERSLV